MDKERKENIIENVIAFLIVIVIIAGIWWWASGASGNSVQEETRERIRIGVSPSLGSPDANVTVIEFSDFECPYCARFALEDLPAIIKEQVETGRVEFAYKYFPLQSHEHAMLAAQAAACAEEQDRFWEYHDILYENQDALEVNQLLRYGSDVGMNTTSFRQCLINEEKKETVIRNVQQGIDAGVTGTPTFFFNGRKVVGALSADEFATEVEKELDEVR